MCITRATPAKGAERAKKRASQGGAGATGVLRRNHSRKRQKLDWTGQERANGL